ncbi:hypothetical protein KP77_23600 [Jeotgalibacillus alimentarius]|uniref:Uncharacterized protein n=1 Tax=Jeotgalibacillus alimentarius TaxID=135826 RepID=A0A0C2VWF8_9BACL|nr:hypothetical protein KP77_23600 [Jeotgalibacillus alimentarius]
MKRYIHSLTVDYIQDNSLNHSFERSTPFLYYVFDISMLKEGG